VYDRLLEDYQDTIENGRQVNSRSWAA
jgi:hypothetical protein